MLQTSASHVLLNLVCSTTPAFLAIFQTVKFANKVIYASSARIFTRLVQVTYLVCCVTSITVKLAITKVYAQPAIMVLP